MEDKEMNGAMGEFANDFMIFCLSLNETLEGNGIKPIKFQ